MSNNNDVLEVFFQGYAGRIHGKYYKSPNKNAPIALLLHPNPLHGGTMDNKVIVRMFNVFQNIGFTVLRVNFRGVGKSEGKFNDADEQEITSVAIDWLQTQNPDVSHFWVCGYSYGTWVASNLMMRRPEIEGFILIAPLVNTYDYSFLLPCPSSGLVIAAENDALVKLADIKKFVEFMNSQNSNIVEFNNILGTDHLFQNKLDEIEELVKNHINIKLATRVAKPIKKKRRRRKKKDSII